MSDEPQPRRERNALVDSETLQYREPHPSLPPLSSPDTRITLPPPHLANLGHTPEADAWWQPKHDLPASLVVFLVALPLCLGIAVASGASPLAGLISGIIGGIVVAGASKSSLAVSGPAAGLTGIVFLAIESLGYEAFLVAVIIGGVFQILLGFVRAGIIAYYFPSAVIKGMLSAIGIGLIIKQLPDAIGFQSPEATLPVGGSVFMELPFELGHFHAGALIIACTGLVILIGMDRSERLKKIKWMPPPLAVVVMGVVAAWVLSLAVPNLALPAELLVSVPAEGLGELWAEMRFPDFTRVFDQQVWSVGFTIAIVASLETLLCIEAIDKLDPFKRTTPTNRELIAQGLGNIACGLLGGLPVTAVVVRGSANVQAGGRTRGSAFFHGVWLLAAVLAIPFLLNMIPLAALAAVLIFVGYKLAPISLFRDMRTRPAELWLTFGVTIVAVIASDLLKGVGAGMVVATFFLMRANLKTAYFIHHQETHEVFKKKFIRIELSENVSFLNKASVNKVLHQLPENSLVEIDASSSQHIHPDVLEMIHDFAQTAHTRDIEVLLTKVPEYNLGPAAH